MKKNWLVLFFALTLSACASSRKSVELEQADTSQVDVRDSSPAPLVPADPTKLDAADVEQKLNLSSEFDQLGIHEKKFNPCLLGYKGLGCEPRIFTMINFKLVCRDSDGTTETSNYELMPFAMKTLILKVGPNKFKTQSDGEGYASMRFIGKKSAKNSMFILSSPPFSLGLRANAITQVILPNDWCRQ